MFVRNKKGTILINMDKYSEIRLNATDELKLDFYINPQPEETPGVPDFQLTFKEGKGRQFYWVLLNQTIAEF